MKAYPHIIPKIEDWPIAEYYRDRPRVVKKLTQATVEHFKSLPTNELSQVLSQTIYSEKLRVKSDPLKVDPPNEAAYWKKLEMEMSEAVAQNGRAAELYEDILQKICHRYAEEITGNFVPKTFLFARKMLTRLFKMLFNPFWSSSGPFWGDQELLLDKFQVCGPLQHIRSLFDKGTVLILPTHFSNLDSILIGYAIEMLTGMPAFSYGAGLNLYDYELLAYYMSRVGAYKVDRRKRNPIYLQATKQHSTLSIQEGLNGIFFPGGTRSRSGSLESSLKLGLLSTLIDAQNEFYLRNFDKKIIIVPLVISYHFVLEAEGLVDQHLRRTGKENYLAKKKIKDPSFKALRFIHRLFKSDGKVTLSFGHPLDIFGNLLDEEARSLKNHKIIDIRQYFESDGKLTFDAQRNRVYTRHLADMLVKNYKRENVVLTSHILTFVCFYLFWKKQDDMDLFSLLTLPDDYFALTRNEVVLEIDKILGHLKVLAAKGGVQLNQDLARMEPEEIIEDGIKQINLYHLRKPLYLENDFIKSRHLLLLYYYSNRLIGYELESIIHKVSHRQAQALQAV